MTNRTKPGIPCDHGDGNNLALPQTLSDDLEGSHLNKVNMILLEYARDAAMLQSRAYDAILNAICAPREE